MNRKVLAPAADRNKVPILEVLKKHLKTDNNKQLSCLEISSGSGQHVVFFASSLPDVEFQPSELTDENLRSIQEYVREAKLQNVLQPLKLDILEPVLNWNLPKQSYDVILNINMIHITPWECSVALFEKSSQILSKNGLLISYGPYAVNGVITPESNCKFDMSLKERNPEWGLRDIAELEKLANKFSMELKEAVDMPSNNKTLIWKKL